LGEKAPVDNRDTLAGDEEQDEKNGKDRTGSEENDDNFE
jgi:hypothetical protein